MTQRLGARAVSGFKWGGVSVGANVLFQLGFTAAMARLLEPGAFGLMAMCTVALRLFAYFSQLGLGAALVQRAELTRDDIRCAVGLTWAVGGLAALAVVLSAPLLGWFFRAPDVVPILRVLSLNLVLLGLGGVSVALLRRALRFRDLALVETTSYVLGYGVIGVGAAWAGAGVWSLVASTFGQSLITLVGAWAVTRHPLVPTLRGDRAGLLGYGGRHSFITFLEFLGANLDTAVIGRLLGEAALGVYNRALVLANQPVEKAAGILSRVLFPLLSAVQGDRRKVGGVFLLGVAVIGVFGGAVSFGLSAAAGDVVLLLLGAGWSEAAGVIEVLSLAVPLMFMSNVAGVVCDALALLRFKLRVQALGLAGIATLLFLLYPRGLRGVAWAIVGGEAVRLAIYLRFLTREVECARRDVARVLAAVALACAFAYGACAGAAGLAAARALANPVAVALEVAAGALALACGAIAALRLLDGTEPASLADASVPGWQRLRARLRAVGA